MKLSTVGMTALVALVMSGTGFAATNANNQADNAPAAQSNPSADATASAKNKNAQNNSQANAQQKVAQQKSSDQQKANDDSEND